MKLNVEITSKSNENNSLKVLKNITVQCSRAFQLGEKKIEKIEAAETSSSDSRNEFHEKSLDYVKTLLSIEEKKKYVLPETFLLYTQRWTLFLRDTNEKMKAYEEPDGIIEKQLNDSRDKVRIIGPCYRKPNVYLA